jgi:Sec-independent protein secretion pathway components
MLEGWEWIVVGIVAIVIILWGPTKIPEFARALGKAKGEFKKASTEFNTALTEDGTTDKKEDTLIKTAHDLGISTAGKTRQQIADEINVSLKA